MALDSFVTRHRDAVAILAAALTLTVAALLGLSHNLQLGVVAEGVETLEQANWLWQHGCDVLQGFLFSRPLPAQDMALYLHSMPHTSALCPLPEAASDPSARGV
mgnify:CR=1 FL=1